MVPWRRWREPLAVTLLVALALMLAVRVVALWLAYDAGNTGGRLSGLPGGDDLLLLATAGAVLWCATPVSESAGQKPNGSQTGPSQAGLSPRAWPIAVAGAVVVGATVLCWLVLAVWNILTIASTPAPDVDVVLFGVEGLLRMVVPVAALVAAVLAVRRVAIARATPAPGLPPSQASATQPDDEGRDTSDAPAAPERLPAAWLADEATGAVWLTADDAAQGRPGLSWSNPTGPGGGAPAGWAPAPRAVESTPAEPAGEAHAGEVLGTEAPDPRPGTASAAEDDDLR